MEISDEGRKRLLQAGFIVGLAFANDKYIYSIKDLPEDDFKNMSICLNNSINEIERLIDKITNLK
jgi:hypothetical protein